MAILILFASTSWGQNEYQNPDTLAINQLPRKEFEVLFYLASPKGKVLDRRTILNHVWGTGVHVVDRTGRSCTQNSQKDRE
ncbi:winged helix-turn-helix domain-containing protein [Aliifodinibius sp. S!AR15-10]|uniref:winged helix-turn-helix domain-containing protein n=1 Tax=Aliifodinibius sp. S!AR15-10 TaxID=2950437 RepID=UPI00287077E0|nr:winged helix-turn-helix domain-containing protein [Aliifodinibius sp. S!AR15-10]